MKENKDLEMVWAFISAQTVAYECLEFCKQKLLDDMKDLNGYDSLNRSKRNKMDKEIAEISKSITFFTQRAKRLTHEFAHQDGEFRRQTDERVEKIYKAIGL
jgi:endonuclease III-like uncharacterized protein